MNPELKLLTEAPDGFSVGQSATLACLLEASIPKVGNVHRSADFDDMTFYDFLVSAVAIGKVFDQSSTLSIGQLIYQSVGETALLVGTNTNLGIALLLAPIAKAEPIPSREGIRSVLDGLNRDDRDLVFEAIRLANPGGLGKVKTGDVNDEGADVDLTLLEAMNSASERDMIAKQYATGFADLFDYVLPSIVDAFSTDRPLTDGLVQAHLKVMAKFPDSLISRKCGQDAARESSFRAQRIVENFEEGTEEYLHELEEFDFWLRADGHRRNPGTSADLIAAGIFLAIRLGKVSPNPLRSALAACRQNKRKNNHE